MRMHLLATALASSTLLGATAAFAQWVPGSEIVGQSVQVETNGVVNTIHFDPGGQARVITPGGNTVNAAWTAGGGQLCLNTGAAQECWPYQTAFQPGQQVVLTSVCGPSRWLASATNQPLPPPPPPAAGERG